MKNVPQDLNTTQPKTGDMNRIIIPLLFFALVCGLSAAPFCINPGGAATFQQDGTSIDCFADEMFTGGQPFAQASMGAGALGTLRYPATGQINFSYTIPAAVTPQTSPAGLYVVALTFVEPSLTTGGARVFNVTVNGQRTPNIDLVALTGGPLIPYRLKLLTVSYGQIRIDFTTVVRNAIINEIRIDNAHPLDLFSAAEFTPLLEADFKAKLAAHACAQVNPASTGWLCPVNTATGSVLEMWDKLMNTMGPVCMRIEFTAPNLQPVLIYDFQPACLSDPEWWATVR